MVVAYVGGTFMKRIVMGHLFAAMLAGPAAAEVNCEWVKADYEQYKERRDNNGIGNREYQEELTAAVLPAGTAADRTKKPKTAVPTETASSSGKRIVIRLSKKKPSYGARAISYPEGGLAVPVPIHLIRGVHPVVRVSVNGSRCLDLLVDTGSNVTFVPPGVFGERHGQEVIHLEKLCFENSVCFEGAAVRAPQTNYTQNRSGYYNGLLGVDLLRYTGLTIDYKNRQMFLGNGDAETRGKKVIRNTFFMDKKTQRPHAVLNIGVTVFPDILLDTGSAYTRLTPPMVRKLEAMPTMAYLEMAIRANGIEGTQILSLQNVCVNGDACVPRILGQKANWPAVGGTFFRNFLTTFDFRKKELVLRPYGSSWTPRKNALQRLGLQLHILEASTVVWVEAESPAAKAGITVDSTLETINDRPIRELGYFGAHNILGDPARRSFEISFRGKDGRVHSVQVKAREP